VCDHTLKDCERNILQSICRNFHQIYNFGAAGDKDKLDLEIRFSGHKIKC